MFLIFDVVTLLFLWPVGFYESPEDSNVGVHVAFEIELILLSKPELTVIVIKSLFRHTYRICWSFVTRLFPSTTAIVLTILPPSLDCLNGFSDSSLFALLFVKAWRVQPVLFMFFGILRIRVRNWRYFFESDENKMRFQKLFWDKSSFLGKNSQGSKGILCRMIDNHILGISQIMLFENIKYIHSLPVITDFMLLNDWLVSVNVLKDKGLQLFLFHDCYVDI